MISNIIATTQYSSRWTRAWRCGGVGVLLVAVLGTLGAGCERSEEERQPSKVSRHPVRPQTGPLPLTALRTRERHTWKLPPGESRSYALPLQEDQFLHLVVEQRGVDVVAKIKSPTGDLLLRVDSPNDVRGPEDLFLVARTAGRYVLGIESSGGAGDYEIRVESLRTATDEDEKRAQAAAVYSRARLLEKRGAAVDEVTRSYQEAARLWGELGDESRKAWSLYWAGKLNIDDPARREEVAEYLTYALGFFERVQDEYYQAVVLGYLGRNRAQAADLEQAIRCYEKAIVLWRKLGDGSELATRLNDLAIVRVREGKLHAAIDLYSRAIKAWRGYGEWNKLATIRTNLGLLYSTLGESRLALDQYRRALELLDRHPDDARRAVTLNKMGDVLLWTDGPEAALVYFRQALELRRQVRDPRGEAVTLNSIGLAQIEANRPREALQAFGTVVEIFQRTGDGQSQAFALINLGLAFERLGRYARAGEHYEAALRLAREHLYKPAEETVLFGLARVARAQGRLDEAESWMEQSLGIVEEVRGQVRRLDLRASFHAARQEHYAFLIDLLAQRHRLEPERGHDAKAFAVSERARARSLLDLLSVPGSKPDPEELRRLDELSHRINDRHLRALSGSASPQVIATPGLEEELTSLLSIWQQENATAQGPRPSVSATLSLQQVQDQLLDEETLVLEYFLSKEQSYLWAITSSTRRFIPLPGKAQIEEAARRTYERLIESHHQTGEIPARQAAERLSQMILAPVADLLGQRRLVIVAHGALQAVPFAVLPRPDAGDSEARPLFVDHDIVHEPSLSVLAAMRSRTAGRQPPEGFLAVVADPVLEAGDDRLSGVRSSGKPIAAWWGPPLRRLPYAQQEAQEILALAGSRRVLSAFGFEANRDLVKSGVLRGHQIVHFATHGFYNDVYPELSGFALSAFDSSGRPVDGQIRAYEVSQLDLDTELAVLSACSTGLGKEVDGEGMVGLTQAFMHAGVPRLVVSLWNVNDRSTSELMSRFYAGLVNENLTPAQALRKAQLALWRDGRWQAPYYWAGFIVQGEWQ